MIEGTMTFEDVQETGYSRLPKDLASLLGEQVDCLSEFSSLMGSVLGHFLWDLSKCPHIACTIANKGRIGEMLEVTRCSLMCYSAACLRSREPWPGGLSPEETRLTLSLAGLAANLAAVAPQVLVSCGRCLIKEVIKIIPNLTAEPLCKLLLDLLYNVSLHEGGAARLLEKDVLKACSQALTTGPDTRLSALKLLASITSRELPLIIANLVPIEKVKMLYQNGDAEMSHYAEMILNNMAPFLSKR